jgi:hypothetical protein
MLHVYGSIKFRDTLFDDNLWSRNFHYAWPVLPDVDYSFFREYHMPIWGSFMEEADVRQEPARGWAKVIRRWNAYLVWLEKQEAKTYSDQNPN